VIESVARALPAGTSPDRKKPTSVPLAASRAWKKALPKVKAWHRIPPCHPKRIPRAASAGFGRSARAPRRAADALQPPRPQGSRLDSLSSGPARELLPGLGRETTRVRADP
jgi:hypothetical protein